MLTPSPGGAAGDLTGETSPRDHLIYSLAFKEGLRRLSPRGSDPISVGVERDGREMGFLVEREPLQASLDRSGLRLSGDSYLPQQEQPKLKVGDLVSLPDGRDLFTGEILRLERPGDSLLLFFFWASWCGACQKEIHSLPAGHSRGLLTVGVSLDDDQSAARKALQSTTFGDMHVLGGGWFGNWSRRFRVYRHGIPWSVLVGRDGRIVAQGSLAEVLASIPDSPGGQ